MSWNRLSKPWVTSKLINIIKAKFRLFKQYKLGFNSFQYYNYFQNKVTFIFKGANKNYFEDKIDRCSRDSKIPGNYKMN